MTGNIEPREGQVWTHRQYGGLYRITPIDGSKVRVDRADGRVGFAQKMLKEQLWEHYSLIS